MNISDLQAGKGINLSFPEAQVHGQAGPAGALTPGTLSVMIIDCPGLL